MKPKSRRPSLSNVATAFRVFVWPRRGLLAFGLLLIFVNRFCGLVLPGATKFLMDDVISEGNKELLPKLVLAVGAAVTLQAITSFSLTRLLSVEAQRLIAQLRSQVQSHVIKLPVRFFDETKSGALVSRIMNDVEGVRNLVGTGVVQMVGGVITAGVSFFLLVNIDPVLTAVALIPLALFGVVSLKAFSVIRPVFRKRAQINAEVTGRLTESLGGIRVIKGFNAEAREEEVFEQGVQRIFDNVKRSLTATSLVASSGVLLMGLTSAILMYLGGDSILDGRLTVGEFFAFTLYLGFLVTPVMQMANIGTQLTEAFAGLDRTNELLAEIPEFDDPNRTVSLPSLEGEIHFRDVDFSYNEGKSVLHGVDFLAPPGSVTALVGSSGSGKSTIFGLAAAFLKPTSGRIEVDGVDLATVRLDHFRNQLGLVLQDDFLFEGTIRDNVLFGRPDATEEELVHATQMAYVSEFTDGFELGIDTLIGERGVKLSGGQRQRVAIARAILADPRILFLDEATSSLDTESERFIQESLGLLMNGRTTFVIAHRLSTIRRADQILVIEDGRIIERGSHDDLIAAEGRYHDLYTYQARI